MNQNNLKKLASEWFEKGNHDLDEANLSFRQKGWTDIICFHCQQAVEKYLKGFLVFKGVNVGKFKKWQIYDLQKLCKECQKFDGEFKRIEDKCILLNPYYIESRYPLGKPIIYLRKETKEAIEISQKIKDFILRKIR